MPRVTDIADFLGGFIAAEGCFTGTAQRFTFSVGLGAIDTPLCEAVRDFLGCGHVTWSPRRKPHYDDESTFAIQGIRDHLRVTIPFMDEHLPASHKREQYLEWRARLLDYWEHEAKRVRPCGIDGCDEPRRAKGLCRRHYYKAHHR